MLFTFICCKVWAVSDVGNCGWFVVPGGRRSSGWRRVAEGASSMMSVTGILVGSLFHTLSAQRADEHEQPEQRLAHARERRAGSSLLKLGGTGILVAARAALSHVWRVCVQVCAAGLFDALWGCFFCQTSKVFITIKRPDRPRAGKNY